MAKQKKPKIKSESLSFQKAFTSGKLPKGNKFVNILLKYSSKITGKPLKRSLRSRKAREEYNKALTEYNKQRPTAAKEHKKRAAIREKQRETVRRTSLPESAARAVSDYDKMVDVMEIVKDSINQNIRYEESKAIISENPNLSAHDIAGFIVKKYNDMQNSLPSFAQADQSPEGMTEVLASVMEDTNTSEISILEKALQKKAQSPRAYNAYLRSLKKKQQSQRRSRRK